MVHVTDDADNGNPRLPFGIRTQFDPLSDCGFVRPETAGRSLIDENALSRCGIVRRFEHAAFAQRNAHDIEVTRGRHAIFDIDLRISQARLAFNENPAAKIAAHQGKTAHRAHCRHTWHVFQLQAHALVCRGSLRRSRPAGRNLG